MYHSSKGAQYYKFTLPTVSRVQLEVSEYVSLDIFNGTKESILTNAEKNNGYPRLIEKDLPSGTYYVKVMSKGTSSYTLKSLKNQFTENILSVENAPLNPKVYLNYRKDSQ